MKRFVLMGVASICLFAAAGATSCSWAPEPESEEQNGGEGILKFNFKSTSLTKAGTLNTDDFWLCVKNQEGETVYSGRFGDRPAEMRVKTGEYSVSALSDTLPMPAFERPVYGDKKNAVVCSDAETSVNLQCTMVNAGLKLSYTEAFMERYSDRAPALFCAGGSLEYPYSRSGLDIAYFDSGSVYFTLDGEYLFKKELVSGEIRHLQVDATSDRGDVGFTITVDESFTPVADSIKVVKDAVLTVAQAKSMPSGLKVTVRGKVAGVVSNNKIVDSAAVKSNIILVDSGTQTPTFDNSLPVEIKKSADQDALSYDITKGKWVTVTGTLGTMYKTLSLTNITHYSIE